MIRDTLTLTMVVKDFSYDADLEISLNELEVGFTFLFLKILVYRSEICGRKILWKGFGGHAICICLGFDS